MIKKYHKTRSGNKIRWIMTLIIDQSIIVGLEATSDIEGHVTHSTATRVLNSFDSAIDGQVAVDAIAKAKEMANEFIYNNQKLVRG